MARVNKKLNYIFKSQPITPTHHFSDSLINWYSIVKRDLPWRHTQDPYKVWLSEIILQQTRIEQGLPYYEQFVESFPTVHDLAAADSQHVMKTWEGLGYYSRARNLHETAQLVSKSLDGIFPASYDGLVKLKGIGPYTAAAIASIAFGEAKPVIDGNVFRFISRYFGVDKDIAEPRNRKYFEQILNELIPEQQPGTFNQAMMEYGATVCKPSPICGSCIFADACYAKKHNKQSQLPIKSKKVKSQERFIAYLILEYDQQTLLRKRTSSIWNGLFEFPNLEALVPIQPAQLRDALKSYSGIQFYKQSDPIKHLLTHRKLWVSFHYVRVASAEVFEQLGKDLEVSCYSREEVLTLPLPKVITNHLEQVAF